MLNLFNRETEEAALKLIKTQGDLIVAYKESIKDREELISHLKRLVDLQESQISDLKEKLRDCESMLEVYSQTIVYYRSLQR
jgi:hypothetical protein